MTITCANLYMLKEKLKKKKEKKRKKGKKTQKMEEKKKKKRKGKKKAGQTVKGRDFEELGANLCSSLFRKEI